MTNEEKFRVACGRQDFNAALKLIPDVDLNWRNPVSGWSLLHVVVEHHQPALVRAIVTAGADLDAIDHSGWTPLCLAVDVDLDGATQKGVESQLEMTRLLLELGGDPRAGRGISAIDVARKYRNDEAVRLLEQSS